MEDVAEEPTGLTPMIVTGAVMIAVACAVVLSGAILIGSGVEIAFLQVIAGLVIFTSGLGVVVVGRRRRDERAGLRDRG